MLEPWFILRVPTASVFVYVMPKGRNLKTWSVEMVSAILNVPSIEFETDNGKPRLPQGAGHVNWSHSKGECVLAYSKECEVGIDLEFYRERNFEAISKRFFAESEATSEAKNFYHLWTKKEAYYKCMGGSFFSTLKNDSYLNAKILHLQGPYKEKHEFALCAKIIAPCRTTRL
ncbi:MAG: 4'-phosphopantetheinyl transferase superfamily protein [Fibromonadaceae bacterium]|jgi:phosphopantetheinyl transferase|nr:4'-phosphopantetheinyl transferase superfamily protein [Fibromonadaceae bacterium]